MKAIICNLILVGEEWSAYCPKESGPGSHRVRSQVGLNDGLDVFLKKKTSFLTSNQCHDFSIVQPVTQSLYNLYHFFPTRAPLNIFRDSARNFGINQYKITIKYGEKIQVSLKIPRELFLTIGSTRITPYITN
jgi:hypothetical protein